MSACRVAGDLFEEEHGPLERDLSERVASGDTSLQKSSSIWPRLSPLSTVVDSSIFFRAFFCHKESSAYAVMRSASSTYKDTWRVGILVYSFQAIWT